MATGTGPADIIAVNGHEVVALCLAALDAVGAALTTSDARGGIAQTGFDEAFPTLVHAARRYGLAAFAQQGSFACGPLGWSTERLADAGLVAVATAVAPAALAAGPGTATAGPDHPLRPTTWCSGPTSSPPSAAEPAARPPPAGKRGRPL